MKPGTHKRLDKGNARFHADGRLLVLKTVAWTDLDDAHLLAHDNLSASWLDFGQFNTFADDIADFALENLEHAGKRCTQRLLHLHHFKREDRRALFELCANLGQQGDDRSRKG